jgi:VanZ family protein
MGRNLPWFLWCGYVILWTALLVMPTSAINELPGQEILTGYRLLIAKSLHIASYAVMTVLSGRLPIQARYRWILIFFLMGHATLTEMIQLNVPSLGRSGELTDVAFDNIGVMIGLLLSWKWWTRKDEEHFQNPER